MAYLKPRPSREKNRKDEFFRYINGKGDEDLKDRITEAAAGLPWTWEEGGSMTVPCMSGIYQDSHDPSVSELLTSFLFQDIVFSQIFSRSIIIL